MKQRWNFRAYPTDEQKRILERTFGCVRYVYNWGLALRSNGFKNGEKINYVQSSAALTKLKQEKDKQWLTEVSCVPIQQSLRNLQGAFVNFFEKRAKYPTFNKKGFDASAEYTTHGFKFNLKKQRLSIAKIGFLRIRFSRPICVNPTTVNIIKRPSGRYFISMVVDIDSPPLPKTGENIGVDFGVFRLATLSNGETIPNPKYSNKYQKRLARAQRILARRVKISKRRERARIRVAKIHEKIADSRKDALHKFTTNIVRRFDKIYIEDLNLRGMTKNHCLARSLSDVGIGIAIMMLEYKASWYGKEVIKIDRFYPSSKTCSNCGYILPELPLGVREWICPRCGTVHDRDVNAAKNIKAVGQTVSAHGAGVRLVEPSGSKSNLRRSANHLSAPKT